MSVDKVRDALAEKDRRKIMGAFAICTAERGFEPLFDVLATIKADAQREVADAVQAVIDAPGTYGGERIYDILAALAPYRAEGSA